MVRAMGILLVVLSGTVVLATPENSHHLRFQHVGPALPEHWQGKADGALAALYVGKGTWSTGKEHLKLFFQSQGISYRSVTAEQVREGAVGVNYDLLVVPGGASWDYLAELRSLGAEKILDFVRNGGGYVGICAGAFYATSHRIGGKATGPYGIGLLTGAAYDGTAMETAPFVEGMMDFDSAFHFLMQGLQSVFRIVLFGGPSFRYDEIEEAAKGVQAMAYFQQIDEPAMVTLHYGEGRVFLSGPHLEIEEYLTNWGKEYADPESDWPILERAVQFVRRSR